MGRAKTETYQIAKLNNKGVLINLGEEYRRHERAFRFANRIYTYADEATLRRFLTSVKPELRWTQPEDLK